MGLFAMVGSRTNFTSSRFRLTSKLFSENQATLTKLFDPPSRKPLAPDRNAQQTLEFLINQDGWEIAPTSFCYART
jgi:hypothetical protein